MNTKETISRGLGALAIATTGLAMHDAKPAFANGIKPVTCALNDYDARVGETNRVQGPAVVSGDVIVGGKKFFDNNPMTGAVTILPAGKDYNVTSPYGSDITLSCQDANDKGQVRQVRQFAAATAVKIGQELQTGCELGTGCHAVNAVVDTAGYPGKRFTSAPSLAQTITWMGQYTK